MSKEDEVRRRSYFNRVHKKILHKNCIPIDLNHNKFVFTQYVKEGLSYSFQINDNHVLRTYPRISEIPESTATKYEFVAQCNNVVSCDVIKAYDIIWCILARLIYYLL